ncbi:MAG: ssDNA-binding domain-containing protein [Syntrophomonadaceae bacterium]|nr:ssDNA-binding domain-containing protein [Syntrophomonadaceae bacterium]
MANYDDLLDNASAEEHNGQLSKDDYAAKKKAEREEIFNLSDDTAMGVSCDSEKFRQYLDLHSRFDRYSVVNTLLILAQKADSSRLGDFDHWKKQGGFVKPGQTAISILEPQSYVKDDGTPGTGYNIKKVFDVSQVDTRKIRALATPAASYSERQLLSALISKAPVKITGVDELPGGLGAMTDPETGGISVRKGMEFADTFMCVARELSNADLTTGPDTQADPRFSAYSAAYLLCKKYGVDTQNFDFSNAPSVFDGMNAQAVKAELSQIRDVAENISERMARQLEAQAKAAKNQEAR